MLVRKTRPLTAAFLLSMSMMLAGCSLKSHSEQRVIVIAVENLGVGQVSCQNDSQEAPKSGFAVLCQESIRFTHAFTTSLQSGPALASILTGKDPIETNYRGQKDSFLSSKEVSLPEKLYRKKINSALFSGGAPIFRKTNLQQGFEVFDDFFKPSISRMYRPFSHLVPLFQNWFKENKGSSLFGVFYVPDLLFTDVQTFDDLGKSRNLSFDSQLEELDETLLSLINYLKKENAWNSTTLILVGLNGPNSTSRPTELIQSNLYSERTQVSLVIKPPQKERDEGVNWTVNQNVSLSDLGYSLSKLYSVESPQVANRINIIPNEPEKKNDDQVLRPLLIESFWSQMDLPRVSVRFGPYLIIYDTKWKVFNSFIDKNETATISLNDPSIQDIKYLIEGLAYQYNIEPWLEPKIEKMIKWSSLHEIYLPEKDEESRAQLIQKTAHRLLEDSTFQTLYAMQLLRSEKWEDLQRWAVGLKNSDLEIVSLINMQKGFSKSFVSPCLKALETLEKFGEISRKCDEKLPYLLLEWLEFELKEKGSSTAKEIAKNRFIKSYLLADFEFRLSEFNWRFESPFEFSSTIDPQMLTIELMLSFPKTKKFRSIISKELKSLHEAL